jgi:septum formation protein
MILASASPRRKELLIRAGVGDLIVIASNADETLSPGMPPEEAVCRLAERKARLCESRARPGDVVVAADTVVYLDGEMLGKPENEEDAFRMLGRLSGRRHEVYTGVCVLRDGRILCECERTSVWFKDLSGREIGAYIRTGEPMDKAAPTASRNTARC